MRVVITGVGIVSALGCGAAVTMDGLLSGVSALGKLSLFSLPGSPSDVAGQVPGLSVAEVAPAEQASSWSRADAMAVLAAREALEWAQLSAATEEVHLWVGGSAAGMFEGEATLAALTRDPTLEVERERLRSHVLSAPADRVQQCCGPFAGSMTVCSACSSGANAVLLAASAIRSGRIERALVGGVDALCRLTYGGFGALSALDPAPCRPFDRRRRGLTLGEGAGFLVLESEASAQRRTVAPICELSGWATASESHHMTQPQPSGEVATAVMQRAVASAGLSMSDIDYVNAHGTATPHNDAAEAAALQRAFGPSLDDWRVSSLKGSIGHTLAAAGAIEAAVTALAIERGIMPPTSGLEEVDPACRLPHLLALERRPLRAAMSNAFGFGGTDTVLVMSALGFAPEPPLCARRVPVISAAVTLGPLGLRSEVAGGPGYLAGSEASDPETEALDLALSGLDPARARRFDRACRLATVVAQRALPEGVQEAGLIVGSAFGGVGSTGAILRRLFEKGARFMGPARFPSALPSTLAANPSIYLGLRGPGLTTSDLASSGEAAFLSCLEYIAAGQSKAMLAVAVEEASEVAARVSSPLCSGIALKLPRGEGASALMLEDPRALAERGQRALAIVSWWQTWRGDGTPQPPPPGHPGAAVFSAREQMLPPGPWAGLPHHRLASRVGDHEAAGGMALAVAVGAISRGELREAMVLGSAPDRGYAFVLTAPQDEMPDDFRQ